MYKFFFCLFASAIVQAQNISNKQKESWQMQASKVTIIRDHYGIAHVYGKTDANTVFGFLYAQCEDDFNRIENNYIEKLGRKSEVFGAKEFFNDLYIKLIIDEQDAKKDYANAPKWLKQLLNAYADGINYYLYKNPQVKPKLLTHFEPWYPLLWTDGSIGAISTGNVNEKDVQDFYHKENPTAFQYSTKQKEFDFSSGSNGFAVSPQKTSSKSSILYINPHVTFYFRPEIHMISEEGLNAYGATTWGQFFIYQGFNENCGWMHTSSSVDVSDMYEEKITEKNNAYLYQYENKLLKVKEKIININYIENGIVKVKPFKTYATHHGPIMASRNGKWIAVIGYNRSLTSLIQSWQRTKAKGLEDYKTIMGLKSNTSNNTVFADSKGNIAYWHGNYVPKRNPKYNWEKPVDGTVKATEWNGLHAIEDLVHIYNPTTGFIQNCNSTPFTASGSASPNKNNYPKYMAPDGENFRGVNASRLLADANNLDIDKIITLGYNKKLIAFEILVPALTNAFNNYNATDKQTINEAIAILKNWNFEVAENSVATLLAIEWAEKLSIAMRNVYMQEGENSQVEKVKAFAQQASATDLITPFITTIKTLEEKFGTWNITWGQVNRFQRITNADELSFADDSTSMPMAYASALWGCLPSYVSKYFSNTNKRYGVSGNSFVCAVEFGLKIKAKSLLAGGNSGVVSSSHFKDQLSNYAQGIFKEVNFYKEDVLKNKERIYMPGE
jgi:acyl-homoserine-lactone acylase